ncbi:MAG: TonB family protein [Gemmatimonadota bacterium]
MFTTLLESRAVRTRRTGSTTVSALLHGALIAGAVALTLPSQGDAYIEDLTPRDTIIYVPVSRPVTSNPAPSVHSTTTVFNPAPAPALPVISINLTEHTLPPVDMPLAPPIPNGEFTGQGVGSSSSHDAGGASIGTGGEAIDVNYVERIPRVLGNPPVPRYPGALRQSGVSGQVVVRFVIDTLGRAELGGVTIQESSHPLFSEAVRNVLLQYRFAPGEVGGRKVRTMVQQPFTFTLK